MVNKLFYEHCGIFYTEACLMFMAFHELIPNITFLSAMCYIIILLKVILLQTFYIQNKNYKKSQCKPFIKT